MRPFLSICIPTFNRAKYLGECLGSFLSQIRPEVVDLLEILVSDNASTDNTREYFSKFQYVTYSRNEKTIQADAHLDQVTRQAKGEWVWMFGDDDIALPGSLDTVLSMIEFASPLCGFILLNKEVRNRDLSITLLSNQNPCCPDIVFDSIKGLCSKFGFFTQTCFISTALFRRAPIMRVDPHPYLDIKMEFGHFGVWLEAFAHYRCRYLSDILVCQRQGNNLERPYAAEWQYISTEGICRVFEILVRKKLWTYFEAEGIREQMIGSPPCRLIDLIPESYRATFKAKLMEAGQGI